MGHRTIGSLVQVVESKDLELGIDTEELSDSIREERYNFTKSIFVPFMNREYNFTIKSNLLYASSSFIPIIANVTAFVNVSSCSIIIMYCYKTGLIKYQLKIML